MRADPDERAAMIEVLVDYTVYLAAGRPLTIGAGHPNEELAAALGRFLDSRLLAPSEARLRELVQLLRVVGPRDRGTEEPAGSSVRRTPLGG